MNSRLKKLVEEIQEVAQASEERGEKFEHNVALGYILMEFDEDDYYMFQNEESYIQLLEDYENSCVCDHVTLEEYIRYISQGW